MHTIRLGLLYVLSVPLGAGLASVEGWSIAGFRYSGWLWMAYLAAGLVVVGVEKAVHKSWPTPFPYRRWAVWFAFVWLSLLWCTADKARGIQDALQISMPLIVGMASSLFIHTPRQFLALVASFVVSFAMIATSLAAGWAGLISLDASATGLRCAVRVVSLSMAFISAVALGGIGPYRPAAIAGWTACLLVTVASGSRIATLSILAILAMHPGIGRLRWRLAAVVAFVGLGVALFYLPVFQNRFFYSGSGTLADVWEGKFDDAGRFYAWRAILPEIGRRPWIGSGVGSIHDYVPTVWPESVHIHNDYLRIAYEFGIVGLALFLAVVAWQILDLWRHTRSPAPAIRWASLSAVLGIAAFLITALTDNTLMYNLWFTNPLFTMIGAVYGLAAVESGAATAAAPIAAGSEQ